MTIKRNTAFLLRLPVSLKTEALTMAKEDGTSLNQFISLAVAEKVARLDSVQQTPPVAGALPVKPGALPSLRHPVSVPQDMGAWGAARRR